MLFSWLRLHTDIIPEADGQYGSDILYSKDAVCAILSQRLDNTYICSLFTFPLEGHTSMSDRGTGPQSALRLIRAGA